MLVYRIKLSLIVICLYLDSGFCLLTGRPNPKTTQIPVHEDLGVPLFLTPLIEARKINEAQRLAKVAPLTGAGNIRSYSGFLTVNKVYNSNLFFWYFPAETNHADAPVVFWLEGGPGASGMFGLFIENGPFSINENLTLKQREYSWSKTMNIIYIDSPVGTGYSFTDSEDGFARNETRVGEDLYQAVLQFLQLFPELQKNEFYVTGESYGGKYVPALSYTIHIKNQKANQKINFKGLAIGNAFCDPEHMLKYGDYLYQLGLIDVNAREKFREQQNLGVKYIREKKWDEAYDVIDQLLNGNTSLFYTLTGFTYYFNYLQTEETVPDVMTPYVQLAEVRKALHVGNLTYNSGEKVAILLKQDVMQSVKPWVEVLLNNNYRTLFYTGQLDLNVAYPYVLGFLQSLKWSGTNAYKTAPRVQWHVDGNIAGYAKTVGNFTEVLVRNAGHLVPANQPKWTFDLINRFISNQPF